MQRSSAFGSSPFSRVAGATSTLLGVLLLSSSCSLRERSIDHLRAPNANVVLLTIDTLRADHLGSYGYSRQTTPALDAVARDGVRFDLAFSPRGLTFPALASLMTSKYVYSHGVIGMFKTALPPEQVTLAEILKQNGYRTVGFTGHLGLSRESGFDQGLDEYFLFHSDNEPQMFQQVARWLTEHREQKFFMWVHSFGPHSPYQAPEPWRSRFTDPAYDGPFDGAQKPLYDITLTKALTAADRRHVVDLYDGKVRWVDEQLSRLFLALQGLGLDSKTLVVVTADHGEELLDHFLFFSHEASVYDGALRIPLLLRMPGRLPGGRVITDAVVESVDIAPTVLDVLGIEEHIGLQGQSLLPLVAGTDDGGHEYAYGSIDDDKEPLSILTIRSREWRYISNPKGYAPWNAFIQREELYDLRTDPGQKVNVVERHPEVAARLRKELERWQAWTLAHRGKRKTIDSPELEERLEALGYVKDPSD